MSKCDIEIAFDRHDRVYRGGETVSGTVRIQVNRDITCNGIKLSRFWKTHGRGNTDSGAKHEEMLEESCQLSAGETLEHSFSFVSDCRPPTYRGHYVNVDHYVRVDVDVPWAIDPKLEEEYILLPGERPVEMTGRRDEVTDFKKDTGTKVNSSAGKIILFVVLGILLVALALFALVLVPILLVVGAIYWIWKKAIEGRVGDVEVKTPHLVVAPGEAWPLELGFTPRKSFNVNGITVKLTGRESATSGSGTDRTTHYHSLFEEVHTLHSAGTLRGGEPILKQMQIDLPATEAFSFDGGDNKIEWRAEFRIDMPRFPDWTESRVLQLVPREFLLDEEASGEQQLLETATPRDFGGTEESSKAWSAAEPLTADELAISGRESVGPDIVPLLERIAAAGPYGHEQEDIVAAAAGQVFDVTIEIDRVVSTLGSLAGAGYHNGRTVTGTFAGTGQPVQCFTRDGADRDVDRLARGDRWQIAARIHAWDSLYSRLVLVEA